MSGFGMARLKLEGCHMHPDEILLGGGDLTDEQYIKQLLAYVADTGDASAFSGCIRDDLANQARETSND